MSDIGNNCVCCNQDTSFGSGRFVNRIPADADYESLDDQGNTIFAGLLLLQGFELVMEFRIYRLKLRIRHVQHFCWNSELFPAITKTLLSNICI